MATAKQRAANRDNAKASTGPTTPEGKATAAANSVKHGLTANSPLLPDEDVDEFAAFVEGLWEELQPETAVEHILFGLVTIKAWRLRRVPEIEAQLFEQGQIDAKGSVSFAYTDSDRDELAALQRGPGAAFDQAATRQGVNRLDLLQRYSTALENSLYRALGELRVERYRRQQAAA